MHGAMAFLAWGLLLPISINLSLFQDIPPIGSLWFKYHQAFNTTAYALFVAPFSIAISYTTKGRATLMTATEGWDWSCSS